MMSLCPYVLGEACSVGVQPRATISWLLAPCGDKGVRKSCSTPSAGRATGPRSHIQPAPPTPALRPLQAVGHGDRVPGDPLLQGTVALLVPPWCFLGCYLTLHKEPGSGAVVKGIAGV